MTSAALLVALLLSEPEHIACVRNANGSQDCAAVVESGQGIVIKRFHCEASRNGKTQWCAAVKPDAPNKMSIEEF